MCGIAGYVGQGSEEILRQMLGAIKYRGPDDQGFFVKDNVGLAQARLSIIDLSPAGHQPMSNEDGTIQLVLNGEIYNFRELMEELVKNKKHQFKSQTDTEVIIHLYEEIGEAVFEKLNGMFAIALYDFRKNKLILARDRMGKKPLYWSLFGSLLVFGSEVKALLKHPAVKREIDLVSLNKYLLYEYVPTPRSIFKNIYKLEPATCLVWQNCIVKKEKFWEPDFSTSGIFFGDALQELDKRIEESVKARLVSDVPLGIFLSGGLDSSAIAYYAQKNSSNRIKTFSIGFEEKTFDESKYAKKAADFLNTEHHHKILTSRTALELIPQIAERSDEPLADASIIPTYFLSQFTKQFVTVALGGDGGDELLAGYPTFQAEKLVGAYEIIPAGFRNLIEKIVRVLPVKDSNFSLNFKLKKFINGVGGNKYYRHQRWLGSFDKAERQKLFRPEVWQSLVKENEFEELDIYAKESRAAEFDNQLLYLYLRTYLMDGVLVKVDRASMYKALEIRAPLLDYKLFEFVNRLPYNYKYRHFQTKFIFKRLMADKLPKEMVFRAKKGFGVPMARWLKNELKDFCNDILSESDINNDGFFNYAYIDKLKKDHFSSKVDNHKLLWTLISFQLWKKKWG